MKIEGKSFVQYVLDSREAESVICWSVGLKCKAVQIENFNWLKKPCSVFYGRWAIVYVCVLYIVRKVALKKWNRTLFLCRSLVINYLNFLDTIYSLFVIYFYEKLKFVNENFTNQCAVALVSELVKRNQIFKTLLDSQGKF